MQSEIRSHEEADSHQTGAGHFAVRAQLPTGAIMTFGLWARSGPEAWIVATERLPPQASFVQVERLPDRRAVQQPPAKAVQQAEASQE